MIKKITTLGMALAVTVGFGAAVLAAPLSVGAMPEPGMNYSATLLQLNDSGVTGSSQLSLLGKNLNVKLQANGLEPGQPHVVHIHGHLDGIDAMCPTDADDPNGDGFVSVFEGAPKYGPIKLSLTNPQTPFGVSPNNGLFAPFAGTPSLGDFPMVSATGALNYDNHYTFDMSKSADRAAFASLTPLDKQHIVVHGAFAPESVDTAGGSSDIVYDPLLPVACGEIQQVASHAAKHAY
jgi:hypothetical protein